MKGRITTLVDPDTAQCFITGQDRRRYEFELSDWRGDIYCAPQEFMEVNFEIDGTHARTVYAIDKVFEIIRQYPGPVTLQPSPRVRARWAGILLLGGLFMALGGFAGVRGAGAGWVIAIFGGLGVIAAVINLLPGANGLRLDKDGFEIAYPFRRQRIEWDASLLLTDPSLPKDSSMFLTCASLRIRGLASTDLLRIMREWCKLALDM